MKLEIKNKKEAEKLLKDLKEAEYIVEKIEKKETKRNPCRHLPQHLAAGSLEEIQISGKTNNATGPTTL